MKKFVVIAALSLLARAGFACDVCATRIALQSWDSTDQLHLSVFEQYSKYDRPSDGGHELESYSTQLGASYRFSDRWAVQANIPYLDRDLDGTTESGIGDASIIGIVRLFKRTVDTSASFVDAYAGIKLPTGDTDPLKEERDSVHAEEEIEHEDEHEDEHEETLDTDHDEHSEGHHLSLGSGSVDGIFGLRGLAKSGPWLASGNVQYILRTEGDYDYEYGDEFIVTTGTRYYVVLEDAATVAVGFDLYREWQDNNEVLGQTQDGHKKSASYIGPAIDVTVGDRFTAGLAADFAIEGEDEGLEGAADTRVRATASLLF